VGYTDYRAVSRRPFRQLNREPYIVICHFKGEPFSETSVLHVPGLYLDDDWDESRNKKWINSG